jgi:hypothetical protein
VASMRSTVWLGCHNFGFIKVYTSPVLYPGVVSIDSHGVYPLANKVYTSKAQWGVPSKPSWAHSSVRPSGTPVSSPTNPTRPYNRAAPKFSTFTYRQTLSISGSLNVLRSSLHRRSLDLDKRYLRIDSKSNESFREPLSAGLWFCVDIRNRFDPWRASSDLHICKHLAMDCRPSKLFVLD